MTFNGPVELTIVNGGLSPKGEAAPVEKPSTVEARVAAYLDEWRPTIEAWEAVGYVVRFEENMGRECDAEELASLVSSVVHIKGLNEDLARMMAGVGVILPFADEPVFVEKGSGYEVLAKAQYEERRKARVA